jgi:hypothetical protein
VFSLSDATAKSIPFRKKELRVGVQDVAFCEVAQHVAVQVGAFCCHAGGRSSYPCLRLA